MKQRRVFETKYDSTNSASLRLSHPKYQGRSDRLDLITNQMLGIKTSIGGKKYTVCDISETGFAYAEKVPIKNNISYNQVRLKVDKIAISNYGKSIDCICFFDGRQESGGIKAKGTIRNHHIFLILSPDEIKRIVTTFLQSRSISRSHDPDGFYRKLDLLLSEAVSIDQKPGGDASLRIVLNTTFQNLIREIGGSADVFHTLYQGYINKPVYVKYGVSVDNYDDARKLFKFAQLRNVRRLKWEEGGEDAQQRQTRIDQVNRTYSFNEFIRAVWKTCLEYYQLGDDINLPKIDKVKVAQKLKEEMIQFNGHLEKLGDPALRDGDSAGVETYLSNGLYWYLIEIDKKFFNREVIKKDIRKLIVKTYENCLTSV